MTQPDRLLVPGRTCWRTEHADRLAFIVDAADYFRHAKAAMLQARHSILLIGWDFDLRIEFEPEEQTLEGPNGLGEFLRWLSKTRRGLRIYVLKWDLGAIQALGRGMTPVVLLSWTTSKRLRFKLDGAHPVGAAHHQKVVVIDDALAFCGGIDMTADRWDTRAHRDEDPCRVKPTGAPYGPWHDATTAVDADAARALGDLARDRWRRATGEQLEPAPETADIWPDGLAPTLRDVDVAIARTHPKVEPEDDPVREVERLYLEAIAGARRTLYFESQYLASRTLAEAMARRLAEPHGPEIVVVLPREVEGWLESEAMDGARAKLLRMLWDADRHRRFAAYYPVTEAGESIYVHAKITVADDRLLRVGSSNLNNRSMGFDTECDLAVEVTPDTADASRLRETIVAIRHDLLAEHLGTDAAALRAELGRASGSLIGAIEALRGPGRSLRRFTPDEIEDDDSVLAENDMLDPERQKPDLGALLAGSVEDVLQNLGFRRGR
jgi:phosphatidylserine/phosphatidylglycerophosphate/cardiolipin synthase-like enzyme